MSHENTFLVHKSFSQLGLDRPVHPERVVIVLDHRTPANTLQTANVHAKIRSIVRDYGLGRFFEAGEGICHQLLVEERLSRPGQLVLGTDSHTTTSGAVGAFATGIGATEMAGVWATGSLWLKVPETVQVDVRGALSQGVYAKDLALHLAKLFGPSGADYRCLEFTGDCSHDLTIASRMVLSNMGMEVGAKAAVFPADTVTAEWFADHRDVDVRTPSSDGDAGFIDRVHVDASKLPPLVSGPHRVEAVKAAEGFAGVKVDQAFIGSCTNGRLEDIAAAAAVLKGRKVAPGVRLIVGPASRRVMAEAIEQGFLQTVLGAGGTVIPPGCGPCLGAHEGVLGPGEVCISSTNRNFPGRMGAEDAEIYLASPATVAASAVEGSIADPRRYLA
jgi:homoaconitate hydratase family protein